MVAPRKSAMSVGLALASMGASNLYASQVLEEVLVTAEYREVSVQQTPLAITAVSAEMLEARSQTSITDVAAQAPNVTLQPGGGTFGPALQAFIRGVGQDDFNLAYEPGVGVYVDDVYFSTLSGSLLDLIDLDRVEILRGPQGTLAGKNSIGGSIKLYTQKPMGDDSGYVAVTYGDYDRTEIRGAYDVSLIPDTLFLRMSGMSKNEDGYVDRIDYGCANPGSGLPVRAPGAAAGDCSVGTEGGRSFSAARASLRWIASDELEINISGDFVNDNSEAIPNHLAAIDTTFPSATAAVAGNTLAGLTLDNFVARGKYVTYSTYDNPSSPYGAYSFDPVAQMDSWGLSTTVDWKLSDNFSLKSITAYRELETIFTLDSSGSPIPFTLSTDMVFSEQFSQEIRLNGTLFDNQLDFTVGGFMLRADNRNAGRIDIQYIGPGIGFGHIINDPIESDTDAVFAHAVWHINDKLDLTAGIRYTEESKEFRYTRKSLSGDGTVAIPTGLGVDGEVSKQEADNTDYRLNLGYRLTDEVMVYGQFATGFKGGGPSPRPFFASQLANSFGPETVDSYELGMKGDFFDNRLRVNAAFFLSEYKDKQIVLFACPTAPCASPDNAGDADISGFEIETVILPTDNLQLDASYSTIDFEYQSLNPAVLPTGVTLDSKSAFTPENQFSIGAQYRFNLSSGATITPRIDGSYKDEFYTSASNLPASLIESYWLWNARMTWLSASEKWQVSMEVTNFTDEFYYQSLLDNSAFTGIIQGSPAAPRKWAFTFKKSF